VSRQRLHIPQQLDLHWKANELAFPNLKVLGFSGGADNTIEPAEDAINGLTLVISNAPSLQHFYMKHAKIETQLTYRWKSLFEATANVELLEICELSYDHDEVAAEIVDAFQGLADNRQLNIGKVIFRVSGIEADDPILDLMKIVGFPVIRFEEVFEEGFEPLWETMLENQLKMELMYYYSSEYDQSLDAQCSRNIALRKHIEDLATNLLIKARVLFPWLMSKSNCQEVVEHILSYISEDSLLTNRQVGAIVKYARNGCMKSNLDCEHGTLTHGSRSLLAETRRDSFGYQYYTPDGRTVSLGETNSQSVIQE
jgi:hypothetical protein